MAQHISKLAVMPKAMKSGTNSSTDTVPELQPESVELIFRTFSRRFGHKFKATYEDNKARDLWMRDLRSQGITDQHVHYALDKCASLEWPPSVGEFIRWCKPTTEDLGLPNIDSAYREAAQAAATGWTDHHWSHPAVYQAAREITVFEWTNLTQREVRPMFERAYSIVCNRVMNGEQVDAPIPKGLPPKVYIRSTTETAREGVAAMRQALNGGLDV